MFDKYAIIGDSVRNVKLGGETIGFAFDSRITYYRGLGVSMVEPFEIRVDGGEVIPVEQLRFSLDGHEMTWADMENDADTRWELDQRAVVTALVPGGLPLGEHTIEATECLRVSYLPYPSRTKHTVTVTIRS